MKNFSLALLSCTAIAGFGFAAYAQSLPEGNGKQLVQEICGSCHDLSLVTNSQFSREDWDIVVKSMISMGAEIKPDQAAIIAGYLAANFPAKK